MIVRKVVINDDGGNLTADNFSFQVDGGPATAFLETADPLIGENTLTVNAGTYDVTEANLPVAGYGTTYDKCQDVVVPAGGSATCTITNDDQQTYVIVDKVVINNNGGDAEPNDFLLTLDGAAVLDGVAVAVDPGTYTAGETLLPGYTFTGFSGACDENGDVTVALGETKTCVLINNDIQPKLTLVKTVINDNGGTLQVADFPLFVDGTPVLSGVANGFDAGTYTASETEQYGYAASDWGGDCAADGSVTLSVGDNKTCTITNDDIAPTLTLVKTVVNDDGGTLTAADFPAFIGTTSVPWSVVQTLVGNASYTASETEQYGYAASDWGGDCAADGTVTLQVGDNKTCTITNDDQQAYLKLTKTVVNGSGGTAVANDFARFIDGNAVSWDVFVPVNPGSHIASETTLAGYTASAWGGDCAANGTVSVALGESKTCSITNTYIDYGQIGPTGVLCSQYVNGTAPDFDVFYASQGGVIQYQVKANKISATNPGVFFYWTGVSQTITGSGPVFIDQSDNNANIGPFAPVPNDIKLWLVTGMNCTQVQLAASQITISNGDVTVDVAALAPAGSYYVISVKYDTGSVKGTQLGNARPTVKYTFTTDVGNNGSIEETDTKGITLAPKR